MGRVVGALQALKGHMRINLGRPERGVSQQFLNTAQVSPTIQKVGGRGVPQRVWAEWTITTKVGQQAGHHGIHGA